MRQFPAKCFFMTKSIGTCDNRGLCCEHLLVEAYAVHVMREPRIQEQRPLRRHVKLSVLDACWFVAGPGMPCPFLTPEKRCDIYATRPEVCVAFVPGTNKCQQLRKEHGLSPAVLKPAVHQMLNDIKQEAISASADESD
jgi:Fe-S-cluster containining protein